MPNCDFHHEKPKEAKYLAKTTLGVNVEREHYFCKDCWKQVDGWEIIKKL